VRRATFSGSRHCAKPLGCRQCGESAVQERNRERHQVYDMLTENKTVKLNIKIIFFDLMKIQK
jgi:hypothetical protein